jgi:GT2 family glycosyltransferase/glycosyltransferase involved in cell wall biosynthesis
MPYNFPAEAPGLAMKKITSALGTHRIAARLVARVLGALGVYLGAWLRRGVWRPSMAELFQVRREAEDGWWRSGGPDPQLLILPPFPRGWVQLAIHIKAPQRPADRLRLYLDRGAGYREDCSYDLGLVNREQVRCLHIQPGTKNIRLDPLTGPGRFQVTKLEIRRISAMSAAAPIDASLNSPPGGEADSVAVGSDSFVIPPQLCPYDAWLEVNRWNERREAVLHLAISRVAHPPLLSMIMPVYSTPVEFLNLSIQSVARQVYQNWELCADDASADPQIDEALRRWSDRDNRIKVTSRSGNGSTRAGANTAAGMAAGDYLIFMDHDDEIAPDALAEVALHLSVHPGTDILYSDEDKLDEAGRRCDPHFKPDWSPELLLSYMYMARLLVIRRSLFRELGGFREGFEGSQDYDLILRATDISRQIGHIPKVLYHSHSLPASTESGGDAKAASFEAGRRALQEALDRRGIAAEAFHPRWSAEAACAIYSHKFPDHGPRVGVIVPTRNNVKVLRACLESLEKTTYKDYEVLVVDNDSDDPATLAYLRDCPHRVARISSPGGFSFAAINNEAVRRIDCDYVLFLNDDTEVVAPRWLSQMVGYMGIPGVGAVGARLLYPDGRIQHCGHVHSCNIGLVSAVLAFTRPQQPEYNCYGRVARNYSAVKGACMLTGRSLFLSAGGFDEQNFAVALNDLDYCYRLVSMGYRVVYCPDAELIHTEGHSRGSGENPAEEAEFRRRYKNFRDGYYNPNLRLDDPTLSIDARTSADRSPRPLRALMCTHNLNLEGAPYIQLELATGLRDRGFVDPVIYSPTDGPLRKDYEARGMRVEVFQSPLVGYSPPDGPATVDYLKRAPNAEVFPNALAGMVTPAQGYQLATGSFAKWIRELGVDLVYGNTLETFHAIEAAAAAGLPSIWNPRESEPWHYYFTRFGPYINSRALKCFFYPYKVVFTANASLRVFEQLDVRRNFMTIHDGLDQAWFRARLGQYTRTGARKTLGIAEDEVMLLTVGTVENRKGQLDAVGAIDEMQDGVRSSIRWFVVGDRPGDYSSELHRRRGLLGPEKASRLSIVPQCPEAALYYSAADIYVCSSRIEAFPRVILEAMAAGLPIVTTPVFGILEQVREGRNAIFYQPGDTKDLADRVARLAVDTALRERMGNQSPIVLNTVIDYECMVDSYGRVFREAWISGGPRGEYTRPGHPLPDLGPAGVARGVDSAKPRATAL